MKIKICLLIAFNLIINSCAISQNKFIIEVYEPNINKVATAKEIVYYGLDLKLLKLTDINKIEEDGKLRNLLSDWIAYFENQYPPSYLKKYFKKDSFIYSPKDVQKRYQLTDEDWVIMDDYKIGLDELKSEVLSFELKEKDGVGFVIIVDNFNKRQELTICTMTFFDIESKEILWATKVWGNVSGWGMKSYWTNGIFYCFGKYMNYYPKKIKLNK